MSIQDLQGLFRYYPKTRPCQVALPVPDPDFGSDERITIQPVNKHRQLKQRITKKRHGANSSWFCPRRWISFVFIIYLNNCLSIYSLWIFSLIFSPTKYYHQLNNYHFTHLFIQYSLYIYTINHHAQMVEQTDGKMQKRQGPESRRNWQSHYNARQVTASVCEY